MGFSASPFRLLLVLFFALTVCLLGLLRMEGEVPTHIRRFLSSSNSNNDTPGTVIGLIAIGTICSCLLHTFKGDIWPSRCKDIGKIVLCYFLLNLISMGFVGILFMCFRVYVCFKSNFALVNCCVCLCCGSQQCFTCFQCLDTCCMMLQCCQAVHNMTCCCGTKVGPVPDTP